ncbi:DUF433 domain-containing protein [Microbulbifer sp. ZKSA002]
MVANGMSIEEIADDFPHLNHAQILAAQTQFATSLLGRRGPFVGCKLFDARFFGAPCDSLCSCTLSDF